MNESKATRYQRLRRRCQIVGVATGGVLLTFVALTPVAAALAAAANGHAASWPAALRPAITLCLLVGVLALAWELVAMPASLYAATRVARRFRRTDVKWADLVTAQARDAFVGAILALTVTAVLRGSMWAAGASWWAAASLALTGGTLVTLHLLASGMAASGEAKPLAGGPLAGQLAMLAERACGRAVPVREWTPATVAGATALVTGVGPSGHVLLSTDMVRDWKDDEIAVVVAHELSHHAHHDFARTAALDAALWAFSLWSADRVVASQAASLGFTGVADLAALPLLAVVAATVWLLVRPLRLAQSRAHERRADRFALELTGSTEAFGRALTRLGEEHLAEERPSRLTRWFFHRHPTVEERLRSAVVAPGVSARRR